jgi:sec-independent protein translocase protein TatB
MPDFGINLSELFVLAVVAVLIFGPEKLPDVARKAGRVMRYLRGIANDAREHVRDEFGDDVADFDPRGLHPKNLARSVLGAEAVDDLNSMARDTRSSLEQVTDATKAAGTPTGTTKAATTPTGVTTSDAWSADLDDTQVPAIGFDPATDSVPTISPADFAVDSDAT